MWGLLFKTNHIPRFQGKLICQIKHRLCLLTREGEWEPVECSNLLIGTLNMFNFNPESKINPQIGFTEGIVFVLLQNKCTGNS